MTSDGPGGTVRYWKGGQGPALLLIHGAWGDAHGHWSKVWDLLAENFTVVAPDLPGWGLSTKLEHGSCSDLADAIAAVARQEKLAKFTVVGNSFGAAVAWRLGADHPELVQRVVLVNGGPLPILPRWLRETLALEPLRALMLWAFRMASFRPDVISRAVVDPSAMEIGFVERAAALGTLASEVGFDAVRFQKAAPPRPLAPVALLWGEQDSLVPLSQAQRLGRKLGAPLVTIAGGGHIPQMQYPDAFVLGLRQALLG